MTKLEFLTALIGILCFQMCATLVRSFSWEMLSSLQEVDLRLKDLKDRMDHVNGVSLQVQVCDNWHTKWNVSHPSGAEPIESVRFISLAW